MSLTPTKKNLHKATGLDMSTSNLGQMGRAKVREKVKMSFLLCGCVLEQHS